MIGLSGDRRLIYTRFCFAKSYIYLSPFSVTLNYLNNKLT